MRYNNKGNKFNKDRGFNKREYEQRDEAPKKKFTTKKPVTTTIPFVVTGKDQRGNEYNANSATALVEELCNDGVFTKLSVMATMTKANLFGKDDAKGNVNLARVMDYNSETGDISLLFFGKNVDHAERMENMVVVPRVMTDRETSNVTCITGFEVVPAMEA